MLKKGLLVVAAVVGGLAAIVVGRALTMESLQPADVASVQIEVDGEALLRFAGAVRIPTISHETVEDTDSVAFRALHDHFERSYPLVHENLSREVVGGLSLLYTWGGSEPRLEPVVLMGHMDVVPVVPGTEDDWTHPPFSAVVDDGHVWGRGTMDDKVSVVAILEAAEALLAEGFRPRRTHFFAFGHDEEVGGLRGAKAIAELLERRGAEPYAYVIDEGGAVARDMLPGMSGAVAMVGMAEKGYVNLELVVEGQGGHSSMPPANTNIGILAEAISELEENPFPARLESTPRRTLEYIGPEMGFLGRVVSANLWLFEPLLIRLMASDPMMSSMVRTTTAATIIEGGVKANVLPITARAVVNHRILPGDTRESVLEYVTDVIDDERVQIRILGDESTDPSPVSDPSGEAFQLLARTIKEVVPEENVVVAPYLVMAGTDAKHYSGRSTNVFRFLAAPVGQDAVSLAHGTDERMSIEGLFTSIQFFQQLIRNSDGL